MNYGAVFMAQLKRRKPKRQESEKDSLYGFMFRKKKARKAKRDNKF